MRDFRIGDYVEIYRFPSEEDKARFSNRTALIEKIDYESSFVQLKFIDNGEVLSMATICELKFAELRISGKCDEECSVNAKKTVSILGTTYSIQELSVAEDISLKDCDGYCDKTDKRIVIAKKESDCDLGDFEQHRKKTMRHEIIHAYLNESGLAENFENKRYGIPETLVDWFAIQSPKIFKTFEELDIL